MDGVYGACKALYTGAIPVAASNLICVHNGRSGAVFGLSVTDRE